eukprot:2825427-Amphidinium_carterae.2
MRRQSRHVRALLLLVHCFLAQWRAKGRLFQKAWLLPSFEDASMRQHGKTTEPVRRNLIAGSVVGCVARLDVASAASEMLPTEPPSFQVDGSMKLMPAIGFGTCCRRNADAETLQRATLTYLA